MTKDQLTDCQRHCMALASFAKEHGPGLPSGYHWDPYRFLTTYAKVMTDVSLAEELGVPQACYSNAALTAMKYYKSLVYCEGYAVPDGCPLPLEHAWCYDLVRKRIFEVTWTKPGVEYFGVPFTTDYVLKGLQGRKISGLIWAWDVDFPLLRMTAEQLTEIIHPL